MEKKILSFLFLGFVLITYAQRISLEQIWSGKYYPKSLHRINSANDSEYYTVLESKGVMKYSYRSVTDTRASSKGQVIVAGNYDDYIFSSDEKSVLLQTNKLPIYRHSHSGSYEVYEIETKKSVKIFDGKPIQEPTFSPDGSKVAFVVDNNLYYQDLNDNKVIRITEDGEKNKIINGICDWVYEEEFGFVKHYDWNADGTAIAFVKFDESEVKEVFIPYYGSTLYPQEIRFKYPKAGENNSKVSVWLYSLNNSAAKEIDLSTVENYYIPKIQFSNKSNLLFILTANRKQNKVDISGFDITSKTLTKLFSETDNAWIDTDNFTLEFLPDNSFLWASERDGNRHLYNYKDTGELIGQVTKGEWEITDYYGFKKEDNTIYFQSNARENQRISTERYVHKINLDGKGLTLLTDEAGTHSASFSKNFNFFINEFSSIEKPKVYSFVETATKHNLGVILSNDDVKQRLVGDGAGTKEIFLMKTEKGIELNAWIIKPKNFDVNKRYPVLMFQYSGPGSQQVSNSWYNMNDAWYFMLAQRGYIVVCVDGRGTGYRGAEFKKQTYMKLGHLELIDQTDAAKIIGRLPYVDQTRIGIWGWSYGGFMASNCIFRSGEIFKMAIAVAPVTNWRFYDTVYTERFLGKPQDNPNGYDNNSPITYAKDLEGKYLLVHGTADDNVHIQNSFVLSEALVQAGKDFDQIIYTDKNHGISGGGTRLHLYKKMTQFIVDNL